MVVDFRAYTLKPGTVQTFLEMFQNEGLEPQQRILGNFMGLYRTEIGDVNQIIMMFGYADRLLAAAPCNPRVEGVNV